MQSWKNVFNTLLKKTSPGLMLRRKQHRMLRFYSGIIHPGELCFDIGAHRGDYTDLFHTLGAKVIAVEPQDTNAKHLEDRFHGVTGITVLRRAVHARSGEAQLFVSKQSELSTLSEEFKNAFGSRYGRVWETAETVTLITLDDLIARFGVPAFCKIDVEGLEADVLAGLSRKTNCLSFEFTHLLRHQAAPAIDHLESLGFTKFNYCGFEDFNFLSDRWLTASEMRQTATNLPSTLLTGDIYAQ